MSVADLAKLAFDLIHEYPQYYHYFSDRSFVWNGIPQQNRDAVLDLLPGTDGLKTGHTDAAGYGIVVSTVQHGQRLILVLNGLRYPQLDKMDSAAQDYIMVNAVLLPLWTIVDGRRRGMRVPWVFFVMSLFTSLAFSVAFFLAFMERQLRYNRSLTLSSTA